MTEDPGPDRLDARRKRIHFRVWRRGIHELDLVLGRFADAHLAVLSETDLDRLEALLDAPDQLLLAWLTGAEPPPPEYRSTLFDRIVAFNRPN
jgi:antitoxin CptB